MPSRLAGIVAFAAIACCANASYAQEFDLQCKWSQLEEFEGGKMTKRKTLEQEMRISISAERVLMENSRVSSSHLFGMVPAAEITPASISFKFSMIMKSGQEFVNEIRISRADGEVVRKMFYKSEAAPDLNYAIHSGSCRADTSRRF